jgi:hypothetical protein
LTEREKKKDCWTTNKMSLDLQHFTYIFLGAIVLHRFYIYRLIRPYKFILVVGFLAFRFSHAENATDLLSLMQQLIEKLTSHWHHAGLSLVLKDIVGLILMNEILSLSYDVTNWNLRGFFKFSTDYAFDLVKDFSFVKGTLEHEQNKLEQSFDKDLKLKSRAIGVMNTELPAHGVKKEEILNLIQTAIKKEDVIWEKGHLSGAVYNGQKDHIEFLNKCYSFYSISNPLHPDIWPSVMKFDSEIISMTASLVNGGNDKICGTTSSVRTIESKTGFLLIVLVFSVLGWH